MKDRNFVMQDRVNEHLFFCKPSSPCTYEGFVMNPQNERSSLPLLDVVVSLLPVAPAAAEGSSASAVSDCLYQFAALTAGVFLLATLL